MIVLTEAADREMLADLREAGLITPIVMERIHDSLGRKENPTWEEFLLAGAETIDEREWLTWLIRRHGCYRFGPVRMAPDVESWAAEARSATGAPTSPNRPYRRLKTGLYLTAILRPDQPATGFRAAATLRELRELRDQWFRLRD